MSMVNPEATTKDLMRLAADHGQKRITLSDEDKALLISLLKQRAQDELDYGQEIECETVRVVRRVTGAVGVYFNT